MWPTPSFLLFELNLYLFIQLLHLTLSPLVELTLNSFFRFCSAENGRTALHLFHVLKNRKYTLITWILYIWRRKEGNVLFNDALNTFYLRLYGVGHMVKDHSDSERGNPLPPHGLLFPINSKGSFICTIPDRIAHTTAFVTPVVEHWLEREIAQWVGPHEGPIRRPIAPWANTLTTELHLTRNSIYNHDQTFVKK